MCLASSLAFALRLLLPLSLPNPRSSRRISSSLATSIRSSSRSTRRSPSATRIRRRRRWLRASRLQGFPDADVQTFQTAPKRGNLVARLHGTGKRKPILLLAHIDVVEALRADWSTDPYKLVEQDGYFYGRGTGDDKFMAVAFVANMIRWKKEGYRPDRDIILALTTDEEISDRHRYGINDLIKNHRALIDAEFSLNEGGGVAEQNGKPRWVSVQTSEKLFQSYWLEVTNKGGHSSQPSKDNAIYHLADGLARLEKFDFPVNLNDTTRAYFERLSTLPQPGSDAADMKAILAPTPDAEAAARLSARPAYNAQLRTTCVPTRLEGGHADNALPQLARAMVNCRIVPGETPDEVRVTLIRVLSDRQISRDPGRYRYREPAVSFDSRDQQCNRESLREVLARRALASHHVRRCYRRPLSPQCWHSHVRPLRHGRRYVRQPFAWQR